MTRDELVGKIQDLRDGGAPMTRGIARWLLHELRERLGHPRSPLPLELTTREVEVLEARSQGMTTRKVAECLGISPHTLRCHQKTIYQKLQVNSLVAALAVFRGDKRA